MYEAKLTASPKITFSFNKSKNTQCSISNNNEEGTSICIRTFHGNNSSNLTLNIFVTNNNMLNISPK